MLGSLADTGLDLLASLVTLFGVRVAAMPADREHRFGHGKAEALAALAQVVLISISAIAIGWRAVTRLIDGAATGNAEYGIAVSLVAIVATLALLAYQRSVIRRTGSVAIRTDNVHYQSDLLLNLVGDRRPGRSTNISASPAPIPCSASPSRSGCSGAPGGRRARRSTS